MMIKVCPILVLLFVNLGYLEACNGYTYKINYVRNCNPNSVIKIAKSGYDVTLDKDCNIVMAGCVNVTKPFKTAKGTYSIKKAPMPPLEGDLDFCDFMETTDFDVLKQFVAIIGIKKCPIPARNICAPKNAKISIAQFKNQLGLGAGTATAKLNLEHDTGKSCVEFSGTLTKAKSG